MLKFVPAVLAAAALLTLAAASTAFQTSPAATPEQTRQPGAGERPRREGQGRSDAQRGGTVEGAMKQMNRSLRQLREQLDDPAKLAENLRLVNDIQSACARAKGLGAPENVLAQAKSPDAKSKLEADYRKDLIAAMRSLLEVEEALAAGKTQDAKAKLDVIGEMAERAHKALGVE